MKTAPAFKSELLASIDDQISKTAIAPNGEVAVVGKNNWIMHEFTPQELKAVKRFVQSFQD